MRGLEALCDRWLPEVLSSRISQPVTLMRDENFQHLTGSDCCRAVCMDCTGVCMLAKVHGNTAVGIYHLPLGLLL